MRRLLALGFILAITAVASSHTIAPSTWLEPHHLQPGLSYGSVVLFPIHGSRNSGQVLSLDQATDRGLIRVTEVSQSGNVNQLILENRGKTPVFVMAGEILDGAKQDRILKHDLWLPPRSGPIKVSAYCVEQGRWAYEGASREFRNKKTMANISVRSSRQSGSQTEVWTSVDQTQARAGFSAPSQSLNSAYEDAAMKRRLLPIYEHFRHLPQRHPEMTGVVVGVGGRLIAVDNFGYRSLLTSIWPKLLKSYALEAHTRGRHSHHLGLSQARALVARLAGSHRRPISSPGGGQLFKIGGNGVSGEALSYDGGLVHLELFPNRLTPVPRPVPEPQQPIIRNYPEGWTFER